MNVKGVNEIIAKMKLSLEAVGKIDEILSEFKDAEVSNEAIDKILKIVDIEIDATKLAADIYQTGIDMADDYLNKIDDEAGRIADEIEEKTKIKE